jgi:hypothetical protein
MIGAMFSTALYYGAWRSGILKYLCMQRRTPLIQLHEAVVYHPLTGLAINIGVTLACFGLVCALRELTGGPHAAARIQELFRTLAARPYLCFPLLAYFAWSFFWTNPAARSAVIPGGLLVLLIVSAYCLENGPSANDAEAEIGP